MARRGNQQRNRGMVRDKKSGVVLAREQEHPQRYVFESIPNGTPIPFHMDPEMQQVLAIHVFDNLKCSPPGDDAVYRLVRSKANPGAPLGTGGVVWVPKTVPDSAFEPEQVEPLLVEGVPDIESLDDAQLDALQVRIADRKIAQSQAANLDVPVETDAPEWRQWRETFLEEKTQEAEARAAAAREETVE